MQRYKKGTMKILTILGTRPEIIRLSRIIPSLDKVCNHKILHTGQNYDEKLNSIFFTELGIRPPDVILDSKSSCISEQIGKILQGVESYIHNFKPDKVLILGDTNSGLSAIIVERLGIPVYHMEAGNRCYDLKVPEEKNRKVIDSISSYNLPYTPNSRENLLLEGHHKSKIIQTGNPILEVLEYYKDRWSKSTILEELKLKPREYLLITAHRAENVDLGHRLSNMFEAFQEISKDYPIIFSCHPRTKSKLSEFKIYTSNPRILLCEPFGFFDFVKLEKEANCVITDSGTVQEECCIFKVPTVTIRDTTERPETVECGSNIVSGLEKNDIIHCYNSIKNADRNWSIPLGYEVLNVSSLVTNLLLGIGK